MSDTEKNDPPLESENDFLDEELLDEELLDEELDDESLLDEDFDEDWDAFDEDEDKPHSVKSNSSGAKGFISQNFNIIVILIKWIDYWII